MLQPRLPFRVLFSPLCTAQKSDISTFRSRYFRSETPASFQGGQFQSSLPAIRKWFLPCPSPLTTDSFMLNAEYLATFADVTVPLERSEKNQVPKRSGGTGNDDDDETKKESFHRFTAPLSTFINWTNHTIGQRTETSESCVSLYLAQCDLSNLPRELRDADLPTPAVVREAGKGDVYASSLWMGVPPTNTPLHRDPNPNLLVQLVGTKVVRMVQPDVGRAVYASAREICTETEGIGYGHSVSLRGEEMMVGLERKLLDDFVWEDERELVYSDSRISGVETQLEAGDAVFIPKGWWHSVRGIGDRKNGVNASVNWWFR